MKNVTITLDEETARWARLEAARRETSVSRFIRDILGERMTRREAYRAAMSRYLSRKPKRLKHGGRYPSRDSLHDRDHLR